MLSNTRFCVALGLAVAVLLAGLAFPTATAFAGAKLSPLVTIDTVARKATGGVARTRGYSVRGDTDAFIGCWSSQVPGGATAAGCSAKRGTTTVSCTVDPALPGKIQDFMWAMSLMGPNAYLEFTWNGSNRCQSLEVVNDSRYAPKAL